MSEVAGLLIAIAALITAAGTWRNSRQLKDVGDTVKEVNKEVKTMNSQSIAELADADESRRIGKIPKKNRTALEKSHLADVGRK